MQNGPLSVLVVEDDREINELVGAYAQIAGFEYRAAHDGASALREAKANLPTAIVLDVMLPDIDGFEVCRRLRSDENTRSVPVIILTAMSDARTRQKGAECGATQFMIKPFDPDQFISALQQYAKASQMPGL